jgi:hypothetical protein
MRARPRSSRCCPQRLATAPPTGYYNSTGEHAFVVGEINGI